MLLFLILKRATEPVKVVEVNKCVKVINSNLASEVGQEDEGVKVSSEAPPGDHGTI